MSYDKVMKILQSRKYETCDDDGNEITADFETHVKLEYYADHDDYSTRMEIAAREVGGDTVWKFILDELLKQENLPDDI